MGIGISGDPSSSIKKLKSIVKSVKNGAEAIAITEALQQTNWKRKQAAALLGISYKALLYKMRDLDITPPPPEDPFHSPQGSRRETIPHDVVRPVLGPEPHAKSAVPGVIRHDYHCAKTADRQWQWKRRSLASRIP